MKRATLCLALLGLLALCNVASANLWDTAVETAQKTWNSIHIFGDDEAPNNEIPTTTTTTTTTPLHSASAPPSLPGCNICRFFVGYIENWLQNEVSEEEILSAMRQVCTDLAPHQWEQGCRQWVDREGPILLRWMVEHSSPDTVCIDCGMCAAGEQQQPAEGYWDMPEQVLADMHARLQARPWEKTIAELGPNAKSNVKSSSVNGNAMCGSCLTLVGLVEDALKAQSTQEEIMAMLERVCAYSPFPTQCKWLADSYLVEIIQTLENAEPPARVCSQLGLCTSTGRALPDFFPLQKQEENKPTEEQLLNLEPVDTL
ncbi:hypothetical protein QOT17_012770 [Balamuthia mandrillaris]